ncbi:MAG TPA: glycoside hydrolase domain-containing protein, partial [Niastella sp.]|nr:glycoside hydrolase domain-containing protein [Niastella sp.]
MKRILFFCMLFCAGRLVAQELKYTSCDHCWNADSLGNHRALVSFEGTGKIAKVKLWWRRRDEQPQLKRIIVQDAQTQKQITNVLVLAVNREFGEIVFEPSPGKGSYYIYYMPYRNEGRSNYPKGTYLKPEAATSADWLASFNVNSLPENAVAKEIQSIDAFNSFYPMEVIATADETQQLIKAHPGKTMLVFPENRELSIRMQHDLPQRWIQKGAGGLLKGTAMKGEYYACQLGIYALQPLRKLEIQFSDLTDNGSNKISAGRISCINTNGTGYDGKIIVKEVNVPAHQVQAMWCGIDVPATAVPGVYRGKAIVKAAGIPAETININLEITSQAAVNGGENEPWKQTRLKWLNSTLAQENKIIAP